MGLGRKFVDSFGFAWQVWEIISEAGVAGPAPRPPAGSSGWLYFFSRGTTRRLGSYPGDWSSRTRADLEDLCVRAEILGAERVTGLVRRAEAPARPAGIPAGVR